MSRFFLHIFHTLSLRKLSNIVRYNGAFMPPIQKYWNLHHSIFSPILGLEWQFHPTMVLQTKVEVLSSFTYTLSSGIHTSTVQLLSDTFMWRIFLDLIDYIFTHKMPIKGDHAVFVHSSQVCNIILHLIPFAVYMINFKSGNIFQEIIYVGEPFS